MKKITPGEFMKIAVSDIEASLPEGYVFDDANGNSTKIFSLDLFTPDELLNLNGGSYVSYYGYDYKGDVNKSSSWNLNDFYVNKDKDNNGVSVVNDNDYARITSLHCIAIEMYVCVSVCQHA